MPLPALLVPVATVLPFLRGAARPWVDGSVESLVVDGFRVHWAREGADAVPPEDLDGNGLPDTVDTVRDTLVAARTAYEADGWEPLVPDDGDGGGDEIDVYLRGLPVYGYATPIPTARGNSCHLQLDPANSVAGQVMASVVFHELHHCVQYRYTGAAPTWLYESGATYQQYSQVTDVVLDYAAGLLWAEWLRGGELPLSAIDGRHEYASFVFTKYWAERGGPEDGRLQRMWTALADQPPVEGGVPGWVGALEAAARAEWGDDLDTVLRDHATWNAFACAADDGAHYDPEVVPCIADATIASAPFVDGETIAHRSDPYTHAYRTLGDGATSGPVRVTCRGPGSTRLVARDADGAKVEVADGDDAQVTIPDGGDAFLIALGTRDRPLRRTCTLAAPRPPSSAAGAIGCATAPGALPAALLALVLHRRRRNATTTG